VATLLDEGGHDGRIGVGRDRQEDDVFGVGVLVDELLVVGHLGDAGAAPGGPVVEDDDLAGKSGEAPGPCRGVVELEVRSRRIEGIGDDLAVALLGEALGGKADRGIDNVR
jgi:hypothetical protein